MLRPSDQAALRLMTNSNLVGACAGSDPRLRGALPMGDMARSWSPTLFRKAFHIKGNDDLFWVSLTYALQVF